MTLFLDRRIVLGLFLSIAVVLGLAFTSYNYFNEFLDVNRWGSHSRKVLYHSEQVRSFAMEIENAQRGYGLIGDEAMLDNYENAVKRVQLHIKELDSLVSDNPEQLKRIGELGKAVSERIAFSKEVIESRRTGFEKARDMVMTLKGKKQMDSIKKLVNEIQAEENSLIIDRSISARKRFYLFISTFIGLIVTTLVILGGLIVMINSYVRSRARAEEKLKQAELETRRINKELESFSYSVSHDLRTPLRSIHGYAQIMKEDYGCKMDEEANRIIEVIMKSATHMGNLIDDLLDFSRLGKQELRKSKINMNDFVKSVTDELVAQQKERAIRLDIQPLHNCVADTSMFRQVWINLISNALKYSRKKESAEIKVGCTEGLNEIEYFVQDNGAGFDMQYQDKLFGVFQRLHKASEFEGTGVGLALVKRIIERHQGRIWAEAKVNEGAKFIFTIPK